MTASIIFLLNDTHALGADDCQWLILSARYRRGQREWVPVSFIASDKDVLLRSTREKSIQLTPEAEGKLAALPDRFSDWRAEQKNISKTCDVDPRDRGPP